MNGWRLLLVMAYAVAGWRGLFMALGELDTKSIVWLIAFLLFEALGVYFGTREVLCWINCDLHYS